MTKVKYNDKQIEELVKNKYIKNCTSKHIIFRKEFKSKAVELSRKYISSKEIFKKFGFPEYIINSDIPKNSISRWKRNVKIKWVLEENKWRKKKEYSDVSKMSKDEELEYLRAKVAVLEELKKLTDWKYP